MKGRGLMPLTDLGMVLFVFFLGGGGGACQNSGVFMACFLSRSVQVSISLVHFFSTDARRSKYD